MSNAKSGAVRDGRDFESEMISLREPDGETIADVYLSRGSCISGDDYHDRAVLALVNGSFCFEVITLSASGLRDLAAFLDDYADKLDKESP
jgi:hypothetical protein